MTKIFIAILFAAGTVCAAPITQTFKNKTDQCFVCHQSVGDENADLFQNDIHRKAGLTCAACHGGDSNSDDMDAAMSKSTGYKGVPKGNDIAETCAKCHADPKVMKSYNADIPTNQLKLLEASVHGQASTTGGERVAQCTTCHGAHGIRAVTDPKSPVYALNVPKLCSKCHSNASYMKKYNPALPVDQYQKYLTSVHGKLNAKGDPKTAECVSCHGSHGIKNVKDVLASVYPTKIPSTCSNCHSNKEYMKEYKIPTDQYANYSKSVHGVALLKKNDLGAPACNNCHGNHGAIPPGVESISNVCGNCHALNAELFSASPHKEAFDKKNYPECETCHGNHDIVKATNKLLGITDGAVCLKCHKDVPGDKGYTAAGSMRRLMDSLATSIQLAKKLINDAEQKGMEVSDAGFKLRDAHQASIEAATAVHSFNLKKFENVVDKKGLTVTAQVIMEAKKAIHDYYFRRIGLAVSVFIISLLGVGLFFYIKKIEKNE